MLKKIMLTLGITIATASLLAGCATSSVTKHEKVSIERVDSSSVKITHAYLARTGEGLKLRGEVKRIIHGHGSIPGHIHIELLDPQGQVLKTADIDHNRKASSAHISDFSTLLPMELAAGSVVRIIHHDMKSHMSNEPDTVWQDVVK